MKHKLVFSLLIFSALTINGCKAQISDAYAPVGSKLLTVPPCVKPILNEWMRDAFVMFV